MIWNQIQKQCLLEDGFLIYLGSNPGLAIEGVLPTSDWKPLPSGGAQYKWNHYYQYVIFCHSPFFRLMITWVVFLKGKVKGQLEVPQVSVAILYVWGPTLIDIFANSITYNQPGMVNLGPQMTWLHWPVLSVCVLRVRECLDWHISLKICFAQNSGRKYSDFEWVIGYQFSDMSDRRVSSGQGKVREIPDLANVREKSGNFVEGQGKKMNIGKSQGICI